MNAGRNQRVTRAILVMAAILMSVVLGSLGVGHSQRPSAEDSPDVIAMLSKQPKKGKSKLGKKPEPITTKHTLHTTAEQVSDLPVIYRSGILTQDETWIAGSVYMIEGYLWVGPGRTLTLEPGVIVKFNNSSTAHGLLIEGGTLNATGSSVAPIIFTSYRDDSVGGNSDGGSTPPATGDYYSTINRYYSGSLNVEYADFRYGLVGVSAECAGMQNLSVRVADSVTASRFNFSNCQAGTLELKRNTFNVALPENGAISLWQSSPIGIALSGNNKNSFLGQNESRVIYISKAVIPQGQEWTASSDGGGVVVISDYLYIKGTLSIVPGTIIKLTYSNSPQGLAVEGTLNINGTASNPVNITSVKDDTIGGSSSSYAPQPLVGDYGYALSIYDGATTAVSNLNVKYAEYAFLLRDNAQFNGLSVENVGTAFNIQRGEVDIFNAEISNANSGLFVQAGKVRFRGNITNVADKGVQACAWTNTNCYVDAAYTDWGGVDGPAPGSVCGQVTVSPWKSGASTVDGGLFASKNCDNAPTPNEQLNSATQHFGQRVANRQIDCSNGFQDACQAMQTAYACLGSAVQLAGSQSPFPLPNDPPYQSATTWGQTAAQGAETFIEAIEQPMPQVTALQFGTQLLGAVNTLTSLANAYNSCAP